MTSPFLGMAFAGVLFGIWPLVMRESGLGGMASTAVFIAMSAAVIMPAALFTGVTLQGVMSAKWHYALVAAVLASVGLVLMNHSLANAEPQRFATLFVIMIMMQLVVPSLYQAYVAGVVTVKMAAGVAAAALAIFLLV